MAKTFVTASSTRMDCQDTNLGNWQYTQPFTVSAWVKPTANTAGGIICKQVGSGNVNGWALSTNVGASNPTFQFSLRANGTNFCTAKTTTEWAQNIWYHVLVTTDGTGTVAGIHIYVNNVDQALTTISNTLSGNSILNSLPVQVGARGGTGSPTFFIAAVLSRISLHNVVLGSADRATLFGGLAMVTTGLQLWLELSDLGATFQPDWSGNAHAFAINFAQSYLAGPNADLKPDVGKTGIKTLSGPMVRGISPWIQNLGWDLGANNGKADQISPNSFNKFGPYDYMMIAENDVGIKSLDVGNQGGTFDYDTPSILGVSTDANTWTFTAQDDPANALFSCNNIGAGAPLKAALHAETSVNCLIYDPDEAIWKCWWHGGNNTGPRLVYIATCSGNPRTPGNWTVQNGQNPVLPAGAGGTNDANGTMGLRVIRVSGTLMYGIYRGADGSNKGHLLLAKSVDRGYTWTKLGEAVAWGAAGAWDDDGIFASYFAYDAPTGNYIVWYGAKNSSIATVWNCIGFAYTSTPETIPWNKGVFNPVFCGQNRASGSGNNEYWSGMSQMGFLEDKTHTYRIMSLSQDGRGGTIEFRGANELKMPQIVLPKRGHVWTRPIMGRA